MKTIQFISTSLLILFFLVFRPVYAENLVIEITEGAEGALPIAVVPFKWVGPAAQLPLHDVGKIISDDLKRSGRFSPLAEDKMLSRPSSNDAIDFRDWRVVGVENLVVGQVEPNTAGGYIINFKLYDVYRGEQVTGFSVPTTARSLRTTAHQIADTIYETLTGENGAFATRIAYVVKITSFKGINGAPAWSPDGRYLAMTLSKDGNPDIYVMNLNTRKLRVLSKHWGIDTEPAWSPDGKFIIFTSDRSGLPQVYRVPVSGGSPERLTFEGESNARASYAPDGKSLVMVTRINGNYRIAVLELADKQFRVLTNGKLDESPSFAPNASMIIYATTTRGNTELSAVSFDGRVRQRLALQSGDVREPVWSPRLQ
ncbi:MAG: Tol-Pal system beta propeller repeat protein TolB [Gammaproteobacteria bacterium]